MLEEALAESKQLLDDVNRRIETSIREIRETEAERAAIARAKAEADALKKEVAAQTSRVRKKKKKPIKHPVSEIREGMSVHVESLGSVAVVQEVLDGGRKVRVRVGRGKASFVVGAEDIFEHAGGDEKKKQVVRVNVSPTTVDTNEIDIRGMTFDVAMGPLEQLLDGLYVSGIETARIIHGKGSGALRKKVVAWLQQHPYVDTMRLGNWNEGSSGVTVITLKK